MTNDGRGRTFSMQGLRQHLAAMVLGAIMMAFAALCYAAGPDSPPVVAFDASHAGPRTVEALTERSILRDYTFAWGNLTHALELNSAGPLNGSFTGSADAWLSETVSDQRRSGVSSRYLDQSHKVEAVFYAPEGDLIELHDTAQYELQVVDGNNKIYDERVETHYVVLMTPGADRWVVRQLQEVQHF
jgi:hypothetical protein